MKHLKKAFMWPIFLVLLLISSGFFYSFYSCAAVPDQAQKTGTHGWKVWANESFISFEPQNKRYCVPAGWEVIGAEVDRFGNATFPAGASGILFHTNDFVTYNLPLPDLKTTVRVVYPAKTPEPEVADYLKIITDAFLNVRTLYPDFKITNLASHTVLITVGIAGDGNDFKTSVYPIPNRDVTIFVRNKDHRRGEELFIHAVAHLFNRHFSDGLAYQQNQAPIPAGDWQELEAAWTEIIFRSDSDARSKRIEDLYAIHASVVTRVFSPALDFPFNDRKIYEEVRKKSVILGPDPTYAEVQYGHYVLAPLVLLSVEGLLEQHQASTTVAELLLEAHIKNQSFFVLLTAYLPKEEMKRLFNFLTGEEQIPYELLEAGLLRYDTPPAE